MKRQVSVAAVVLPTMLLAASAFSMDLKFYSAPLFVGETMTQHGTTALGYQAVLISTTPDAAGYIELFTHKIVQSQESYADHLAIATRAICNARRNNSCVINNPNWVETTMTPSSH